MTTYRKLLNEIHPASRNDNGKVVAALLIGAAVGAVLGVLFAPNSGIETRSNLGSSLNDLGGTLKDKVQQGRERLTTLKDQAVDAVKTRVGGSADESTSNMMYNSTDTE